MVRSCESLFAAMLAGAAGAVVAGGVLACDGLAAAAAGPGVAGALCVGRLVCAGRTGGFGPKNFAHRMITPKESREATRMRSSGVNLSFCPGTLTSTPQFSRLCLQLNSLASLSISPEPGHIQICAKVDGSADLDMTRFRRNGKRDRKTTRLNSSHQLISYAVFCL